MKKILFTIKNLQASVAGKEVLKNINLTVKSGEIHAIMGPNGSGKSTLAYTLMGHPEYKVKRQKSKGKSEIKLGNKNIIEFPTEERARAGLFLAMQTPVAVPGVTVINLLREAYQSLYGGKQIQPKTTSHNPVFLRRWQGDGLTLPQFMTTLKSQADFLGLNETMLTRSINDGFSGGEKKKLEMLQALVLHPQFAIFDEIDTGLDVDALETVAKAIKLLAGQGTGVLIITHYQRILKYLKPDYVHILVAGNIVECGTAKLDKPIDAEGYHKFLIN